jgi:hypothetical protein
MSDSPSPTSDLSERVLEEAADRGETLLVEDLVLLSERFDRGTEGTAGVAVERLEAYAEELSKSGRLVDPDGVRESIDDRAVESDSWKDPDAIYHVGDDRVSVYPPTWYEAFGGETDLVRMIEAISDDVGDTSEAFERGGAGGGVPQQILTEAAAAVGGLSRQEARGELDRLGDEGKIVETASQHPHAAVRLADDES